MEITIGKSSIEKEKGLIKKQFEYHKAKYPKDIGNLYKKRGWFNEVIKYYKRNRASILVAKVNGKKAGFVLYKIDKWFYPWYRDDIRRNLCVLELFVDEKYRGKGVGTALMKRIEEIAKKKNVKLIFLYVHVKNKKAIKFYKKLGFGEIFYQMRKYL